jgi:molybdate transport system regulatory protein
VLAGDIVRASRAAGGGEATLRLPGGVQLVGFAAPDAGLKASRPGVAWVDEASVVIGVLH